MVNGSRGTAGDTLTGYARAVLGIALLLIVVGVSGALTGARDDARSRHAAQADCLWLAARDHGFYTLQTKVVDGTDGPDDRALWLGFVETVGTDECAREGIEPAHLLQALAMTREEAERHFMADPFMTEGYRTLPPPSARHSAGGTVVGREATSETLGARRRCATCDSADSAAGASADGSSGALETSRAAIEP